MGSETLAAVIAGAVAGVVLSRVYREPLRRYIERVGRGRVYFVVALFIVSALFYSVVHEFGHAVVARALGGSVESVAWTVFSGDDPHVTYGHMPAGARPWAAAGGVAVPLGLGCVLALLWIAVGRRLPWTLSACLCVPAFTLLLLHVGCVIPVFTGGGHFRRLAVHYGLGEVGRIGFQLLAAAVSLSGLLAIRWWGLRARA